MTVQSERTAVPRIDLDPGSFRDPSGGVFERDERIYRYFRRGHADNFKRLLSTDFFRKGVDSGSIIASREVDSAKDVALSRIADDTELVLEHPRIPFVSYCYEWPFEMLKAAAELQLDLTEQALDAGYTLKDATPFNVQYSAARPVFIDVASIEPHVEGDGWRAYAQFCQTFYNPLLLQARSRVPFQPWLRGAMEGIPLDHLRSLLPLQAKLRPSVFADVVLQSWLNHRFGGNERVARTVASQQIPKSAVTGLLRRLKKQVAGLKVRRPKTAWSAYEDTKAHYSSEAASYKENFISSHVQHAQPHLVWDLGSNRGEYSLIAAKHADYVVAMDSDEASIGALYERLEGRESNILPLVVDLMNPSPSQGWAGQERKNLPDRGSPDLSLCLALVHHLAIAGNVPFGRISDWLASMSPASIVEFPPKDDPMVQRLLATRKDVYEGYTPENFEAALARHFNVMEKVSLPESTRLLYALVRR
jgi:hypothetical protein